MGQGRSDYERAFEAYMRGVGTRYVSVNESKRAWLPDRAGRPVDSAARGVVEPGWSTLKTFDFVVYGPHLNLLVDVKGRKIRSRGGSGSCTPGRLQNWVTEDDIASLGVWESIFGRGFRAAFVFLYRCEAPPPAALFQEVFERDGEWFSVRAVWLDAYRGAMRPRSARWRTVHVPTAAFEQISEPLCGLMESGSVAGAPIGG